MNTILRTLAILSVTAVSLTCKQEPEKAPQPAAPKETATSTQAPEEAEPLSPLPPELQATVLSQPWTGDLDGMIKRRVIRALVVYNRTSYFIDKGAPRGIAYDAMKEFESLLNRKMKLGKLGAHVVFIPVSRDQLLSTLAEGKGDVAMAGLTATAERQKIVDFTDPTYKNSSEIVVTGPGAPPIATVQDLSGQEVFVREDGSKHESLRKLNEQFRKEGKKEVVLRFAPGNLEDEDILEMTSAGLVKITVADKVVADFWKQIFPDVTLHPDVTLRAGADLAWAIRRNTPQFKAELNAFIETHRAGTTFGNILLQKYLKSIKIVKNSTSEAELKKYRELRSLFEKYGEKYAVDWILMAAQGYQESGLNQNATSHVGAIGVMQLMPATAKELNVGDVAQVEPNVHAGIKYMRFMIDRYYKDEPMDMLNKMLFTFASYNAGPGRIRSLRRETEKRGLDPNKWFNNVEYVVSEKVGQETVAYVSNIYKYYVAYKLAAEQHDARREAKERLTKD